MQIVSKKCTAGCWARYGTYPGVDCYIWKNPCHNKKSTRWGVSKTLLNNNKTSDENKKECKIFFTNLISARKQVCVDRNIPFDERAASKVIISHYPSTNKRTKFDDKIHASKDLTRLFEPDEEQEPEVQKIKLDRSAPIMVTKIYEITIDQITVDVPTKTREYYLVLSFQHDDIKI